MLFPRFMLRTFLLLFALAPVFAQSRINDRNNNAWFMYFGDHPVGGKWRVHLEGQVRRHDVANKWQQLLLRPGMHYRVHRDVLIGGGYAFVDTRRYGGFPASSNFPEHRAWQQAVITHRLGRPAMSHRYRIEQRRIGIPRPAGDPSAPQEWRSQQRARYLVRMNVPITTVPTSGSPRWFLALYDEAFIHFGANAPPNLFDQNRAYAALGLYVSEHTRVELGYMHQALVHRSGQVVERNHTLQLAIYGGRTFRR